MNDPWENVKIDKDDIITILLLAIGFTMMIAGIKM